LKGLILTGPASSRHSVPSRHPPPSSVCLRSRFESSTKATDVISRKLTLAASPHATPIASAQILLWALLLHLCVSPHAELRANLFKHPPRQARRQCDPAMSHQLAPPPCYQTPAWQLAPPPWAFGPNLPSGRTAMRTRAHAPSNAKQTRRCARPATGSAPKSSTAVLGWICTHQPTNATHTNKQKQLSRPPSAPPQRTLLMGGWMSGVPNTRFGARAPP